MSRETSRQTGDKMPDENSLGVVEEAGVAFDPTQQHLDLSKEEKRRTTSLLLAIQAYKELIIKDAEYLREVAGLARRDEGPQIQPATIDAIITAAVKFDFFISNEPSNEIPSEGHAQSISQGEIA